MSEKKNCGCECGCFVEIEKGPGHGCMGLCDHCAAVDSTEGSVRIAVERQRHMDSEGWTEEHDDEHTRGELALAAVCYAAPGYVYVKRETDKGGAIFQDPWPWDEEWDKRSPRNPAFPCDKKTATARRIRELEKAGALIAAEIDRLRRTEPDGE